MEETRHIDGLTSSRGAQWTLAAGVLGLLGGQLLNGGGLGNIFGGGANPLVTGALMANAAGQKACAEKDAEIAALKAEKYTDQTVLALYKHIDSKASELNTYLFGLDKRVAAIETAAPLREQIVQNQITCCCDAANAAISRLQRTVDHLTRTVIPDEHICPRPMPLLNSWTAPAAGAATVVTPAT